MTTLLAGDIGGTKTLLALYGVEHGELHQRRCERFVSADWDDFGALVNHFLASGPSGEPRPVSACFAVAGPVRGGRVQLTNLPWLLEEASLAAACGLGTVELVNDFAVLIYGLPHLSDTQQTPLRPRPADPQAPVAILGAGTGLGVAFGVPTPQGLVAMASEAAHGEFAPRSPEEWALKQWLQADLGLQRLSIERVVSGTGLGEVMRWLLATDPAGPGHPLLAAPQLDLPAAVAAAAQAGDALALRARQLWLGAYGSAAGDLALHSLCLGGLWVGGGTAAKQLPQLQSAAFLEPFLAKGRLSAVVQQVPVMALTDPEAGLFSAACRARTLLGWMGH
ncbi:glucokinase [Cyanobium sp.]|nr:glucokinase [Cyanobium sp.]